MELPPLVSAAIGSLVRKGVLVLFAYFGFDRVLGQGEHAALTDWLSGLAMIGVGLVITQVWAWLSDRKLLETKPPENRS